MTPKAARCQRISLAALAAVGLLSFCGPPAAGAPAPPSGGISVEAFSDDAQGPLKAGGVLTATLHGTRNGHAEFAIPGIAEKIVMKETTPGVYVGTYTVRPGISVSGAAVVGNLSFPGLQAPLVAADAPVTLDSVAPRVLSYSPSKGATVATARPQIYAALSDQGGVGIDAAATQIFLDGLDLTRQSQMTGNALTCTPDGPLNAGPHQVRIIAADRLGNRATTEWQFTIVRDAPVQSFTGSAAPGQTLTAGQTLRLTLQAQPGGKATARIGDAASDIPLGEGKPGLYTGEYTVRPGDDAPSAPVVVTFRDAKGRTVTASLPSGVTLSAGPPRSPRITYPPVDDFEAGNEFQMEGDAPPGATVRVTVNYRSTALGGLFPLTGTSGIKEVTADGKGRWRLDAVSLATTSLFVRDQDTVFTITAVTVAANGDLSPPAKVTARHG